MWYKKAKAKSATGKRRTLEQMSTHELEGKLDALVSQYVRKSSAGGNGDTRCVTCGAYGRWQDMDCGHYISRNFRSTRWDLQNLGVQCQRCNRFAGGMQFVMREYLVDKHGEEAIKAMESRAKLGWEKHVSREALLDQIAEYKAKLKGME